MITYIKKGLSNKVFTVEEEIDSESFAVGSTYEDYLNDMYVPLSDEQVQFMLDNADATIKQIWDMNIPVIEYTLDELKQNKVAEIDEYDQSTNVNLFYYNGLEFWLDKSTRVGLMNSTTILKNAGQTTTTLWLGSVNVTLSCDDVISMLSALEIYALNCYNKTAEHKNNVNNLTTVDEVSNYDYTTGYPDKLRFGES